MKSIIGITPSIDGKKINLNRAYVNAISYNNGIPFIIGYRDTNDINEILDKLDGLVLSGGGDIHSKYFNEDLHEKAEIVESIRDLFEIDLCIKAIEKNIPILAICRGLQVLNVALGGTLNQHIENHSFPDSREELVHEIKIIKGTKLYSITGIENIKINSIHHQCIDKIADSLFATSYSNDGIIESFEKRDSKFVIGVQWHPEALYLNNEIQNNIFAKFIDACNSKI